MEQPRRILILGRKQHTANYERFLAQNALVPVTTLSPAKVLSCHGLLLPGGGDITPAFFGEQNRGSREIDTELDILQLEALELCVRHRIPVLGICKGMQLINVAFGGTIVQDMPTSSLHRFQEQDQYHLTVTEPDSLPRELWGEEPLVNSAHHQCVKRVGKGLRVIQRCPYDDCPEALIHESLPILGLQWHPERLDPARTGLRGASALSFFAAGGMLS